MTCTAPASTRTASVALLLSALLLSACGSEEAAAPSTATPSVVGSAAPESSEDESEAVIVEIEFAGDQISPRGERVDVAVGQPVILRVTSDDASDELHVHSDPDHTFDVVPGMSEDFEIVIDRPGQVAVESHGQHVTIVQLVVR